MTAIVMVDGIAYTRKEGVPCYDSGLGWRECQSDESHLAGALVDAQDELATLRAQLAGVREQSRLREIDCATQEAHANTADARLAHVHAALERLPRYSLAWGCGPTLDADDNGDYLSRDDVLAALGGDA